MAIIRNRNQISAKKASSFSSVLSRHDHRLQMSATPAVLPSEGRGREFESRRVRHLSTTYEGAEQREALPGNCIATPQRKLWPPGVEILLQSPGATIAAACPSPRCRHRATAASVLRSYLAASVGYGPSSSPRLSISPGRATTCRARSSEGLRRTSGRLRGTVQYRTQPGPAEAPAESTKAARRK